jgi:hypothetical protein
VLKARDPSKEPSEIEWGKWSLLGAFKAASAKEVFEKAFIDEGSPDLSKSYEEGRLKWTEPPSWKDDAPQALWGENSVTYFYRTITRKECIVTSLSPWAPTAGCRSG